MTHTHLHSVILVAHQLELKPTWSLCVWSSTSNQVSSCAVALERIQTAVSVIRDTFLLVLRKMERFLMYINNKTALYCEVELHHVMNLRGFCLRSLHGCVWNHRGITIGNLWLWSTALHVWVIYLNMDFMVVENPQFSTVILACGTEKHRCKNKMSGARSGSLCCWITDLSLGWFKRTKLLLMFLASHVSLLLWVSKCPWHVLYVLLIIPKCDNYTSGTLQHWCYDDTMCLKCLSGLHRVCFEGAFSWNKIESDFRHSPDWE